jgi:hypothetical protein
LDTAFLAKLVDQHLSKQRDHSSLLWSVLSFERFLTQVHHGDGTRRAA